jgi:hypothetical protein
MAKRAKPIPMVTQPVRLSDTHPMAESAPAKRFTARSNNTNLAKNDHIRRGALKKQRAILASKAKEKIERRP